MDKTKGASMDAVGSSGGRNKNGTTEASKSKGKPENEKAKQEKSKSLTGRGKQSLGEKVSQNGVKIENEACDNHGNELAEDDDVSMSQRIPSSICSCS
jgi:hypothetical protein